MDKDNDMELVDLARAGQVGALESLFEKHYTMVYRLAYKWCGVKEDAEDIAQEVFVKLVRKLHTFARKSTFKTWLYRIVVNTAKDFDRKQARRRTHQSFFDVEAQPHNPEPPGPESPEAGRLLSAVAKLPVKQKEAVLLVFGEGLSHKETASALGCAETTVSWRIFQAKKRLRKLLQQEIA